MGKIHEEAGLAEIMGWKRVGGVASRDASPVAEHGP